MKRFLTLAVAIAAVANSLSAQAAFLDVKFSGIVEAGNAFTTNSLLSGEFLFDTGSSSYMSFTIGGESIAPGFTSTALMVPAQTDALYQAQLSPVVTGGSINSTFSLDLSSLTTWPSFDAVALLTDSSQLAGNLDTVNNPLSAFPSTFGFYTANANGTNIRDVTANLTDLTVTTVPEPASIALLMVGALAFSLRQAKRST